MSWKSLRSEAVTICIGAFVGAIAGAGLIYLASADDRREAAINAAWNRVAEFDGDWRKSGGGLRRAIELLARNDESLRNIYFDNARLFGLQLPLGVDLNGARLVNAYLQDAIMPRVQMNGALLHSASFVQACLKGRF